MKKEKVNNWKVALVPNEKVVGDGFCAKSSTQPVHGNSGNRSRLH